MEHDPAAGYLTDVAYIPGFYPQMAPVAMRFVTTLNGVRPPVPSGFRYLELGCGLGRVLTTLAAANPQGEFIGVDFNAEHTAAAAREIEAGGLTNARVITSDFAGLPADLGPCQFIALHGVFSWVSPEVREQILAVVRRHLAPGGLVLVSYNALPGWAHLQPIRGILRQYAALRQGDSLQRVRDALKYLVFIRDRHAKYFDDNPRAAAYVDALRKQDARYLAHEYLNEHWTSFYFADVVRMFAGAGLGFVGSLPVTTNFWDLCVRPEFQELFRSTADRLVCEAHKDFCANTAFRWDLYAAAPQRMPDVAGRLRYADDLQFRVAHPGITLPYRADLGVVTTTVQGDLYAALVELLAERSRRLSEILGARSVAGTDPAIVARAVDAGVAMGMFEVTGGSVGGCTGGIDGPLRVPSAFNRAILESESLGGRTVALASTATGTGHIIGDLDAAMLHELVERGRDGLAGRVETRLADSGRALQKEGVTVTDAAERARLVATACDAFLQNGLPQLARLGIVTNA